MAPSFKPGPHRCGRSGRWLAGATTAGSAAGRLVITIMAAVGQWERDAIGERARDALRHKRGNGERVGNIEFGYRLPSD